MAEVAQGAQAQESDVVELSVPALPELLLLPRLAAAAIAARVGFDLEGVEDIRLATEELCLAALDGQGPGRLHLRFAATPTSLEVACTFEPANGRAPAASRDTLAAELTEQLLEALADGHGTDPGPGPVRVWFRKVRHRPET
jgi:serine/threonine-protein kinase RsbW